MGAGQIAIHFLLLLGATVAVLQCLTAEAVKGYRIPILSNGISHLQARMTIWQLQCRS